MLMDSCNETRELVEAVSEEGKETLKGFLDVMTANSVICGLVHSSAPHGDFKSLKELQEELRGSKPSARAAKLMDMFEDVSKLATLSELVEMRKPLEMASDKDALASAQTKAAEAKKVVKKLMHQFKKSTNDVKGQVKQWTKRQAKRGVAHAKSKSRPSPGLALIKSHNKSPTKSVPYLLQRAEEDGKLTAIQSVAVEASTI